MKSLLLSLTLTTSLLITPPARVARACSPLSAPSAPRKLALLIGAWDYWHTKGDFVTLKSEGRTPGPVEDVEALRHLLVGRLGFKKEDVKVLTAKEETT